MLFCLMSSRFCWRPNMSVWLLSTHDPLSLSLNPLLNDPHVVQLYCLICHFYSCSIESKVYQNLGIRKNLSKLQVRLLSKHKQVDQNKFVFTPVVKEVTKNPWSSSCSNSSNFEFLFLKPGLSTRQLSIGVARIVVFQFVQSKFDRR